MHDTSISRSRMELEAEISRLLIHFEKENFGRGPLETKTYILDDLILVRLKGTLTQPEKKLIQTANGNGPMLVKQVRQELLDAGKLDLEGRIRDIVGVNVRGILSDLNTVTGEHIIAFTLDKKPDWNAVLSSQPNLVGFLDDSLAN